eukprot:TRINITY_DN7432_c0_g1_i2.p1 TRINITY_DN7432_c0_g1~~TRINITY_DN7432_c0_g1_i2.p1  ORF type:complete len:582 (+),score=92.84 TRINITY_DN7432_c0_g1_i2:136-1746(+)
MPQDERGGRDRGQQMQGLDTDGQWYTKAEFRRYYGGYREWDRARKRSPPGGGGDWGGGGAQAGGRSAGPERSGYDGHGGGDEDAHPRGGGGGGGGGGGEGAARGYGHPWDRRDHHHRAPAEGGRPAPESAEPWCGGGWGQERAGGPAAAHGRPGAQLQEPMQRADPDRGPQAAAHYPLPQELPWRRRGSSPAPRAPQPQPSEATAGSGGTRPILYSPETSPPGQGSAPPGSSGTPHSSAPCAAAGGGGGAVAGTQVSRSQVSRAPSSDGSAALLLLPAGLPQPRGNSRDWIAATDHPAFWTWLDDGGRTPPVNIGGRHFCPGKYTPTVQVILWLAQEGKDIIGIPDDIAAALTDWCLQCASKLHPFPGEGQVPGVPSGAVPFMFAAEPQPTASPQIGNAPVTCIRGLPAARGPGRGVVECSDFDCIRGAAGVDAVATAEGAADTGAQEEDSAVAEQIARAIAPLQQELAQHRGHLAHLQGQVDEMRRNARQARPAPGPPPRPPPKAGPAPGPSPPAVDDSSSDGGTPRGGVVGRRV